MNVAVVDDILEYREKIQSLLEPYARKLSFSVSTFSSGEEFLCNLEDEFDFSIIFLDIEMEGISGIDVAQIIRKKHIDSIIIFITSHVNYVSDTFRLGAFQFLIKPIDEKAFNVDFERALNTYRSKHTQYVVKWRDTNSVLEYGDITYIEAYSRHLFVHTNLRGYECVGKLQDEYQKLKPYGFSQCHQGYVVNLSQVIKIDKDSLVLKNKKLIPVSRKFRHLILEDFNMYLAGTSI